MEFVRLNAGWNAEPNAPEPNTLEQGSDLLLGFFLDSMDDAKGVLRFEDVSKYRLGPTNDEGWYLGQCRYSPLAPEWGQFYELTGPDERRDLPGDWHVLRQETASRHFLFYFRDNTFEALTRDWAFEAAADNALMRLSPGEYR